MFVPNQHYDILTPLGYRSFTGLQAIVRSTIRIFTNEVCLLEGSPKHRVWTRNGWCTLEQLRVGDSVCEHIITRIETGHEQPLYDPIDVDHPEQAFYTGDVVSHNCSFMGSANTLIPAHKLAMLGYKDPIETKGDLRIYKRPVRMSDETMAHVYQATVDIGMGQGLDYSVINVTDISTNPFEQVAVWRNNTLSATMLAPIIRDIGQYYNNAHVLMEINFEGLAVAEMLHNELEYLGVMTITPHPKKGQQLSGGFGLKSRFGLKMTEATKRVGCSGLKTLFEQDKYIVNDYQTLRELTTFVLKNEKTYEAEVGNNDDIVMTLVLLGWLTLQLQYENYVGISMRKALMDKGEVISLEIPALGVMGDLEQQSIIGTQITKVGGVEIVDDPDYWRETEDAQWLG